MSLGVGRVVASTISLHRVLAFSLVTGPAHVFEIKSFISGLQLTPLSGSSSSRGGSPVVMYIISSIAPRSGGKGNRFCTSSSSEIPVDHTSDRIE